MEYASTALHVTLLLVSLQYFTASAAPAPSNSSQSTATADCEPFTLFSEADEYDRNTIEDFHLQQLLLAGFRKKDVNRYNISQGGFTSDPDNVPPSCILVQYNIRECPNNSFIFIWTVFNAKSFTGKTLLQLTVYDLRVFGFELCDAYKTPVVVSIAMEDPNIDYQDMKKALTDFTRLLPGLSDEPLQPDASNSTPAAKGYALKWCSGENLEKYCNESLAVFIAFLVITSKVLIIAFCYEVYQKLVKLKVHQKTHKWYYIYWAIQVLILAGMIILMWFAFSNQKNIISRFTFVISLSIDVILGMVVLIVLLCQKACCECCKKLWAEEVLTELMDRKQNEAQSADDTVLVPPPLSLCCPCICNKLEQIFFSQNQEENPEENQGENLEENQGERTPLLKKNQGYTTSTRTEPHHCTDCWTILTNTTSLIMFIAFMSYLTQALPAISISYYIDPTASLIKLGFFELAIIILVIEIALLLFLIDKCGWLCYIHFKQKIPDEVYEVEETPGRGHSNASPTAQNPSTSLGATDSPTSLAAQDHPPTAPDQVAAVVPSGQIPIDQAAASSPTTGKSDHDPDRSPSAKAPTGDIQVTSLSVDSQDIVPSHTKENSHQYDNTKKEDTVPDPNASDSSTTRTPCKKKTIKYIEQYLVNGTEAKLIRFGHWKCSCKFCHWLFVTIAFQIIVASLLIGMSAPLLYFLLSIVIDQTSSSNDQFKDILAIIPTIALNGWFLFKYGNISQALKDIIGKANKSAMEHNDHRHHHHHSMV